MKGNSSKRAVTVINKNEPDKSIEDIPTFFALFVSLRFGLIKNSKSISPKANILVAPEMNVSFVP